MGICLISNSLYYWSLIFTCLRSYSKKLVLRVSLGFQTLENNKSTRPAASCFQMFSRVWNPNETLALVFEILRKKNLLSHWYSCSVVDAHFPSFIWWNYYFSKCFYFSRQSTDVTTAVVTLERLHERLVHKVAFLNGVCYLFWSELKSAFAATK